MGLLEETTTSRSGQTCLPIECNVCIIPLTRTRSNQCDHCNYYDWLVETGKQRASFSFGDWHCYLAGIVCLTRWVKCINIWANLHQFHDKDMHRVHMLYQEVKTTYADGLSCLGQALSGLQRECSNHLANVSGVLRIPQRVIVRMCSIVDCRSRNIY